MRNFVWPMVGLVLLGISLTLACMIGGMVGWYLYQPLSASAPTAMLTATPTVLTATPTPEFINFDATLTLATQTVSMASPTPTPPNTTTTTSQWCDNRWSINCPTTWDELVVSWPYIQEAYGLAWLDLPVSEPSSRFILGSWWVTACGDLADDGHCNAPLVGMVNISPKNAPEAWIIVENAEYSFVVFHACGNVAWQYYETSRQPQEPQEKCPGCNPIPPTDPPVDPIVEPTDPPPVDPVCPPEDCIPPTDPSP